MTTVADTRPQHSAPGTVSRDSIDRRIKLFNATCAGVLIAFALLWLVPIAWTIDTAFKPNAETTIQQRVVAAVPQTGDQAQHTATDIGDERAGGGRRQNR